ncbi:MAG: hypothetical protein HW402_1528 [Dehalococcoidales bacterium]|nr:hypothetical protein [Dehalococcoidales bacterium]
MPPFGEIVRTSGQVFVRRVIRVIGRVFPVRSGEVPWKPKSDTSGHPRGVTELVSNQDDLGLRPDPLLPLGAGTLDAERPKERKGVWAAPREETGECSGRGEERDIRPDTMAERGRPLPSPLGRGYPPLCS